MVVIINVTSFRTLVVNRLKKIARVTAHLVQRQDEEALEAENEPQCLCLDGMGIFELFVNIHE